MTDLATKPGADGKAPDDDAAVDETDAVAVDGADEFDDVAADDAEDAAVDEVDEPADADAEEPVDEVEDDAVADADAEEPADETEDAEDDAGDEEPADDAVDDAEVEVVGEIDDDLEDEAIDENDAADDAVDEVDDADAEEPADETVVDKVEDVEPGLDVVDTEAPADETDTELAAAAATAVIAADDDVRSPAPTATPDAAPAGTAVFAWATPEASPKRRRRTLWIGIAAGAAVVGLVASSLVLIAPGTSVAGVPVGGLTPGWATDALHQRLADTTIVLTGEGGDVEVTGADLGASVDARALAEAAFEEHPMWNPTQWFPASAAADVTIDPEGATSALRAAAPELYTEPVDATLAYDAASATYVTTPAVDGEGVDLDVVLAALQDAYDSGQSRVELDPVLSPIVPTVTTAVADETATNLNTILGTAGFYVGDERTIPITRAVAASWLTVTQNADGTFDISADEAAIQDVVDTLPAAINRDVVNATVITDSAGGVLREVTAGVDGRALGDTGDVASAFAAQLGAGNGVYALPVTVQKFATTALARRIEVDISEQRTYIFENGKVVNSYAISSGLPGHDTDYGHFRIYAKVAQQNMGDRELIKADYFTPNVPWISYYNGDEALHGAYWHNNFGNRMSHGCVNMPVDVARYIYDWAPIGTEVWVHA